MKTLIALVIAAVCGLSMGGPVVKQLTSSVDRVSNVLKIVK